MSFWELVFFVLGLACPRTGILPFFLEHPVNFDGPGAMFK